MNGTPPSSSMYLYVIHAIEDIYKIGITSGNVQDRLRLLSTGTHCDLAIAYSCFVRQAREIESRLHGIFAVKHVRGEWYRLNACDIEVVKAECERFKDADPGHDSIITTKIDMDSLKLLRTLSAATGETQLAILYRLLLAEFEKLKKKGKFE